MSELIETAAVFLIVGIVIGCAWTNYGFKTLINETFPGKSDMFQRRPNLEKWKPVANSDDDDRTACYQKSAEQLGVEIRIAYPVPCPVGANYAHGSGHKGIYIRRDQAELASKLTDGMFENLRKMSL